MKMKTPDVWHLLEEILGMAKDGHDDEPDEKPKATPPKEMQPQQPQQQQQPPQ